MKYRHLLVAHSNNNNIHTSHQVSKHRLHVEQHEHYSSVHLDILEAVRGLESLGFSGSFSSLIKSR